MEELNYSQDVQIDPSAIDVEWMRQPNLVMLYSMALAEARQEMDEAKEALDLEQAKTDLSIRDNLERFLKKHKFDEHTKQTETVIAKIILLEMNDENTNVNRANTRYKEAKNNYDVIKAALSAIDTKKAALENLAKLAAMEYFAVPKVPRDLSEEWKKVATKKTIRKTINGKGTRRRK